MKLRAEPLMSVGQEPVQLRTVTFEKHLKSR